MRFDKYFGHSGAYLCVFVRVCVRTDLRGLARGRGALVVDVVGRERIANDARQSIRRMSAQCVCVWVCVCFHLGIFMYARVVCAYVGGCVCVRVCPRVSA